MKYRTILAHWVFDDQLNIQQAAELAVRDFSNKCYKLLSEYCEPENLRFGVGIYSLFYQRWGIEKWISDGYIIKSSCHGRENYEKFNMFDNFNKLNKNILYSIFGAGEFPFIDVYEKKVDNKYHYIYCINR